MENLNINAIGPIVILNSEPGLILDVNYNAYRDGLYMVYDIFVHIRTKTSRAVWNDEWMASVNVNGGNLPVIEVKPETSGYIEPEGYTTKVRAKVKIENGLVPISITVITRGSIVYNLTSYSYLQTFDYTEIVPPEPEVPTTEQTTYVVNYWYDNSNEENVFEPILAFQDKFTGIVGDEIKEVADYLGLFYFRTKDNLPITLEQNVKRNVINVYHSSAYRQTIYNLAYESVTFDVVAGEANIYFRLMALICGDLYMQAKNIQDVVNVDEVDEEHLRHLAKLVNYPWSEALVADRQRESIKFYTMLRRMRGTNFALTNLIRVFGQSTTTLYQPTDNTGVRIINYFEGNELGLYPGDIRVEIPELSRILRDAIEDVKLMGTRLVFAYRLPISTEYEDEYGVLRGYHPNVGEWSKLTYWLQPGRRGWDDKVDFDKVLQEHLDNKLIYKYRDTYQIHEGIDLIQSYSRPYSNMWMFQVYGLRDVRGMLLNEGIIEDDLFLYR